MKVRGVLRQPKEKDVCPPQHKTCRTCGALLGTVLRSFGGGKRGVTVSSSPPTVNQLLISLLVRDWQCKRVRR